jgi:2-hydroxychromene-2-carboxylate isomerase
VKLFDAAWSEGRDINSDSVIDEVAGSIGLSGQELLGKAHTVEIKERLRLQTERAIPSRGVWRSELCSERRDLLGE